MFANFLFPPVSAELCILRQKLGKQIHRSVGNDFSSISADLIYLFTIFLVLFCTDLASK